MVKWVTKLPDTICIFGLAPLSIFLEEGCGFFFPGMVISAGSVPKSKKIPVTLAESFEPNMILFYYGSFDCR
jgi:hypothetical protein